MRRNTFIAVGMLMVAAMITYSILTWDNSPGVKVRPEKPKDSLSGLIQEPVNPKSIQVNIKSSSEGLSELLLKRYYTYCGHTEVEEIKQGSSLLTLSRQEILKLYPDWEVQESSKDRINLFRPVDDFCSIDQKKRYVGIKDGYVAIYYGDPGMKKKKVFRVTDISAKKFPAPMRQQLEEGIPGESEEHLISIIEGLEVYNDE